MVRQKVFDLCTGQRESPPPPGGEYPGELIQIFIPWVGQLIMNFFPTQGFIEHFYRITPFPWGGTIDHKFLSLGGTDDQCLNQKVQFP